MSLMMTSAVMLSCLAMTGKAGNILQNPGFENASTFTGWSTVSSVSWNIQAASAQGKLYHSGNNAMWTQGIYNSGANLSYAYQTVACAAGSTFTANAYFSQYVYHDSAVSEGGDPSGVGSGLFTSDTGGQEDAWTEVLFMDGSGNVLSDYRSVILDPSYVNNMVTLGNTVTNGNEIYLSWVDCQVTNQYDPTKIVANTDPDSFASAITNTVGSGQYMVAPPGTKSVQYRLSLFQAQYESGATYWDDASLDLVGGPAPSVIGNLSPDGSKFFNGATTNFSFTVTSASSGGAPLPTNPPGGIQVTVNGVNVSGSLQFTGNNTGWNIAVPSITSNQVYNISISVSNSAGLLSSSSVNFDTFSTNTFAVYSEDYDFNGGTFIQNPIPTNGVATNSYWGTAGTLGIDQDVVGAVYTGGGSSLAPNYPNRTDGDVAFQVASDLQFPIYVAQSNSAVYNVNLSYNNAGNWLNYTRNPYPSGNYFVYARIAGGAGYGVEYLNILTSGYGTATQTTNNLGSFVLANGQNWGAYSWIPLTDSFGNQVTVNVPSGQQTLQLLSGGGENVIDFVFVPVSGTSKPAIGNLTPAVNSSAQNVFVSSTNLTFTVSSSSSTIAQSGVQALLNGVDVSHTESFTGNNTNWLVSIPLPANQILSLIIHAADANGLSNSITESFDTFSQNNYMFEAVDYDFAGGQFIDNPVPTGNANVALGSLAANSYYYYPEANSANMAIAGVDYSSTNADGGKTELYRPLDQAGSQVATDFLRQKFIDAQDAITNSDFNIGWWNVGEWFNYTRTYPTNKFHIYGRLASGAPYTGLTLGKVTSGIGTPTQTATVFGSFADSSAAGYQTWHWVPLLDTNGQMTVVSLGGVETLRATGGSGANANYYMLVTVAPSVSLAATIGAPNSKGVGNFVITFQTQNGSSYTVLSSSGLTGGTWSPVGSAIAGNGSTVSVTNLMTEAQQYYRVMVQ